MNKIEYAKLLIELGCVQIRPLEPFIYASGLKGPIYCDNRKMISHPKQWERVIEGLCKVVLEKEGEYDAIAGLATAGIPHGAAVALTLKKPFCYVRSQEKKHGKKSLLEGDIQEGSRLLLIEDLVNQGSSLYKAYQGLKRQGLVVSHCLSIVDYQMKKKKELLSCSGFDVISLTDFDHLIKAGKETGLIIGDQERLLRNWHADPASW